MIATAWIAAGACLGAWTRWGLACMLNHLLPALPLGTLTANLIGCFLMGIVLTLNQQGQWLSPHAQLALGTGFLGSLTTFSSFSGEMAQHMQNGTYLWLILALLSHVGGSLLMTLAGIACTRALLA